MYTAQSLIERMSKEMVSRTLERHCCILANLSDVDLVLINDKMTFHFQIILLIFPTQLRLTVAGLWHVSPLAPLLGCLSAALSSNSSCRLAYPALSLVQNALSLSTQLISLTSHWANAPILAHPTGTDYLQRGFWETGNYTCY